MNNKYQLDPFTVSILFNLESESESEKILKQFYDLSERVIDKALTDFLLGKGFSEEELMKFFESENPQDFQEIQKSLEMPELPDFIADRVLAFNKKIYDDRMPFLTEDKRKELEDYLRELAELNNAEIDEALKILRADENPDASSNLTSVAESQESQTNNNK